MHRGVCQQALWALVIGGAFALGTMARAAPGDLDPSFDLDGLMTVHSGADDRAEDVLVQPDGKIIAVGSNYIGHAIHANFLLVRFNPDGSLDTTFSIDGKAPYSFGGALVGEDIATAAALQPDGKIVVVGHTDYIADGNNDLAVARFNADGTIDTTFGGGDGSMTTSFGDDDRATDVVIAPDGKILVSGWLGVGGSDFLIMRLNPNGSLDGSFGGGDGKADFDLGGQDVSPSIALQPDGKIIMAGTAFGGASQAGDFAVIRVNSNGVGLDTSFNGSGVRLISFGGTEQAVGVAVQPDGRIVVGGSITSVPEVFALARLTPDGQLDLGFGNSGRVESGVGFLDLAYGMALQPNGRILVAGETAELGSYDFVVARFNANGTVDTGFGGGDGRVVTPIVDPAYDAARAIALDSAGRIVVAGYADNGMDDDFAIARYFGRIQPDILLGRNRRTPVGGDVYGAAAASQKVNTVIPRGKTRNSYIRIQNDGEPGTFRAKGTRGNRLFPVEYFLGRKDVTNRIKKGKFVTPALQPGDSVLLKVRITADTSRKKRRALNIVVMSTADPASVDKAQIRVRSK